MRTWVCLCTLGGPQSHHDVLFRVSAVACFSRLRELELHNAPELGPDGLAHLTELRQLSRLLLHGIGHRRCLDVLLVSTSKVDLSAAAGCEGRGVRGGGEVVLWCLGRG